MSIPNTQTFGNPLRDYTGDVMPDATTGFTELRTLRMTCMVGSHDYRQGAGSLYDGLLYCSKCGDVIKFEMEDES